MLMLIWVFTASKDHSWFCVIVTNVFRSKGNNLQDGNKVSSIGSGDDYNAKHCFLVTSTVNSSGSVRQLVMLTTLSLGRLNLLWLAVNQYSLLTLSLEQLEKESTGPGNQTRLPIVITVLGCYALNQHLHVSSVLWFVANVCQTIVADSAL